MPKELPPSEDNKLEIIQPDSVDTLEIVPFGTDQKIKLSIKIVRTLIAQPTRTGKLPDDSQCIKFMMLCKAKHLNPFEGDAYFLGYDTQSGPQFSQITAHQVFLKRAEASKGFKGMQSGVIVQAKDGAILEREGDLMYSDEKLIGGWAKVYRKELEFPFYKRLKFETFSTGQSRWAKDGPGMIVKCAEADALRTAFPTHLGGLYIQEEMPPIDVDGGEIPIKRAQIRQLQAPSGSGSETTSVEPPVGNSEGSPTGSSSEAPSAAPAKRLRKKEVKKPKCDGNHGEPKCDDPGCWLGGPNEAQMLMRLAGIDRTKEQLVQVAKQFDALKENEGWEQIGETGFAELLDPANWKLVEPELKAL